MTTSRSSAFPTGSMPHSRSHRGRSAGSVRWQAPFLQVFRLDLQTRTPDPCLARGSDRDLGRRHDDGERRRHARQPGRMKARCCAAISRRAASRWKCRAACSPWRISPRPCPYGRGARYRLAFNAKAARRRRTKPPRDRRRCDLHPVDAPVTQDSLNGPPPQPNGYQPAPCGIPHRGGWPETVRRSRSRRRRPSPAVRSPCRPRTGGNCSTRRGRGAICRQPWSDATGPVAHAGRQPARRPRNARSDAGSRRGEAVAGPDPGGTHPAPAPALTGGKGLSPESVRTGLHALGEAGTLRRKRRSS